MLEIDWHVLDNPSAPRANGSLPPVNAARIARHELLVRLASSFAYARVLRILADVEPTLTKEMADSSLAPRLYARELRARVALTGRRMDENRLRSELRSAVVAYARALHERDVPPQKMLVMVKDAAQVPTPVTLATSDAKDIVADIVEWAIGGYYTT